MSIDPLINALEKEIAELKKENFELKVRLNRHRRAMESIHSTATDMLDRIRELGPQ